jgi:ribosomal protein L7/L12
MDSQILALAERGRKIDAVKVARTTYGYSLREAVDFVDGLSK